MPFPPPPWHTDALPACSRISSPDVGKGHRSQYRRVSWHWHNWELTGYFPVLLQAHLKMFLNKRAKNSLRLPVRSLPGPHSIPTRVPSNTRQGSSTQSGVTGKQDQEPLKRHVTGTAQKVRGLPSLVKRRWSCSRIWGTSQSLILSGAGATRLHQHLSSFPTGAQHCTMPQSPASLELYIPPPAAKPGPKTGPHSISSRA